MANKRIGKAARTVKKKKARLSERLKSKIGATTGKKSIVRKALPARLPLAKERSQLLKQQAKERMVLKQHLKELQTRRVRTVKGADAKQTRREMGKYMRDLAEEQIKKHKKELEELQQRVAASPGLPRKLRKESTPAASGPNSGAMSEMELRSMFANLTT